jgi:YfiH family protein
MYISFEIINNEKVRHGITTRIGGVSGGDFYSMNTGIFGLDNRMDVLKNMEIVFDQIGIDAPIVVMTNQVHSADVMVLDSKSDFDIFDKVDLPEGVLPGKALYVVQAHDAMVTNRTDVALMTFHADCVPVLAWDPIKRVVAAVHSGWKGTSLGILSRVLEIMAGTFGSDVANIKLGIGQAAGKCCYEVGIDVIEAMRKQFDSREMELIAESSGGATFKIDLKEANRLLALRAGVLEKNIEINWDCTICQADLYHSHRAAKGGNRGMMSGIIQLTNK